MSKHPSRLVALVVTVVVVVGAISGYYLFHRDKPSSGNSVEIKSDRDGTYQLGGLTIRASKGTVPRNTKLRLSGPEPMKAEEAPFGANSVRFDLSLGDGRLQPAKPLDISVPLSGSYLPPGGNPQHALLYTPTMDNGGLEVVPSTVSGGVLHAQLYHLSPKFISFPSDQDLIELIGQLGNPGMKKDCAKSVKTSSGTVQFSSASKGWSAKANSPIQSCLTIKSGQAQLTVVNRVNFLLAVASTDGLKPTAANSSEEQVVARLAKAIFPDRKIKAYLGRGASLNVPMPSASLPATVQLQAEPSAFLTEAAWTAVKFLVGVISAKGGNDLVKAADVVLSIPEVIDCTRSAVSGSFTNPDLGQVVNAIVGKCSDVIGAKLGALMAYDVSLWNQFWGRFMAIAGGVKSAWDTFWTTVTGIKMQFVGTLSVVVEAERRKLTCPSDEMFFAAARQSGLGAHGLRVVPDIRGVKKQLCEGRWAYAQIQEYWSEEDGWSPGVYIFLHWEDGLWKRKTGCGSSGCSIGIDRICNSLPSKIKASTCH